MRRGRGRICRGSVRGPVSLVCPDVTGSAGRGSRRAQNRGWERMRREADGRPMREMAIMQCESEDVQPCCSEVIIIR